MVDTPSGLMYSASMPLSLPQYTFEAFLFDCDGTIADSMPLHYQAWTDALNLWNCPFSEELFYAWAGRPTPTIVEMLNEKYRLTMPPQKVTEIKEENYFKLLPQIQPVPEVVEQIDLHYGKIPFAVVSGSPRDSVIKTLNYLNLSQYFECVIGAEDYTHGKPAPDAFLLAASHLQVRPEACLVFEDAELGIQAAKAAKMRWVKIAAPWERSKKTS